MNEPNAQSHSPRHVRVAIAGWVSIVMGVLAMLASVVLAAMVLVNTAGLEVEPGTLVGRYRLYLLAMMVGGILVGLVVVLLGRGVLRGSLISRYVLLALWIIVGGAVFLGVGLMEASLPVLMVMVASVAVPVLLIGRQAYWWFAARNGDSPLLGAELWMREDAAGGRGVLVFTAAVLGMVLALGLEPAGLPLLATMALDPAMLAYGVAVLWFA